MINFGGDSPLWAVSPDNNNNTDNHNEIIEYAINHSTDNNITNYRGTIKTVCTWCDTKWGFGKANESRLLHGAGNYLEALAFLWSFARHIRSYDTSIDIAVRATNAANAAKAAVPNGEFWVETDSDGTVRRSNLSQLSYIARHLVKNNNTPNNSNQAERSKFRYLIVGMIMHLIGDMYAHRILVPMSTVTLLVNEDTTWNSVYQTKYFKYNDFRNFARLSTMISKIQNKEICFTELKYYSLTSEEANAPSLQFNSDIISMINTYTDRPSFCPARFSGAKKTAKKFLNYFEDYSELDTILDSETTGYRFKNYNTYKNAINVSIFS